MGPRDEEHPTMDVPVVYADAHTVIDDPKLVPFHLVVNLQHRLLICLICMTCVDPSALPRHMKCHHFRLSAQHVAQLVAHVARQYQLHPKSTPSIPTQPRPTAIYGLRVESRNICSACSRAYKNLEVLRTHIHVCAKGAAEEPSPEIVYAQTLRYGRPCRYFPVTIPPPPQFDLVRHGIEALRQRAVDSIDNDQTSSSIIPALTHTNAAMAFCRLEGWNQRVAGLDAVEVIGWISLSDDDAVLSAILPVCTQYLADVHTTLKVANHAIKKRLAQFNK